MNPETAVIRSPLDEEALGALARRLGSAVLAHARATGLVIVLTGPLGAGKTTFVRSLAKGLELPPAERVVSPTFTVVREHPIPSWGPEGCLRHIDAYRLADADELFALGFDEMWGGACVTCVEWGERVVSALPEDRIMLEITPEAPQELPERGGIPRAPRRIVISASGPVSRTVVATALAERA